MALELWPLLLALGFAGGVISGWLGIGGGIVMAPLLLYMPPLMSGVALDMKDVAALTMAQGFFAAFSGAIAHRRRRLVSRDLVLYMGSSVVVGSGAGAVVSKFVGADLLKGIFAALALAAAALMLLANDEEGRDGGGDAVAFSKSLACASSVLLGFLLGMVGQAGAFILIPVMLYLLKIPTRIAIGSSLGIVVLSAAAGLAGKLLTAQVPLRHAVALVMGALLGAQIGSLVSIRTRPRTLRQALAAVIGLVAAGVWWDLLVTG